MKYIGHFLKFILRISSVPLKDTDPSLLDSEYFFYTTLDDNAEFGFNIAEVRINLSTRRPRPGQIRLSDRQRNYLTVVIVKRDQRIHQKIKESKFY